MSGGPLLVGGLLFLAWGMFGGMKLEGRMHEVIARRTPSGRAVLPFALGTGGLGLALMVGPVLLVDEHPAVALLLLVPVPVGVFVMAPLVLMCTPMQFSVWKHLLDDLERSGLDRSRARGWVAVMGPWALLMLGLFCFALMILSTYLP